MMSSWVNSIAFNMFRHAHTSSDRTGKSRWFELDEQLCVTRFRQSPDRTVWTFRVQDGPEFTRRSPL